MKTITSLGDRTSGTSLIIRDLQIGLRVRVSNFKPVTFLEPLFFILVSGRESSSWNEMGTCRDNVKPEI